MECSHTRMRASSVSQGDQNAEATRPQRFRAVRSVSTQQLTTNGAPTSSIAAAAELSSSELTLSTTAKKELKTRGRTTSFRNLMRSASFIKSAPKSEVKPQPFRIQALRAQMYSLPIEQGAAASSCFSIGSSSSSTSVSSATALSHSSQSENDSLCQLFPFPLEEDIPKQTCVKWQNLFKAAKNASAVCHPVETLAEIPNASIKPWHNTLESYVLDITNALKDFVQLSISNTKNCKAYLLKGCLEKAIDFGNNIHPLLFSTLYKLNFYQHEFTPEEALGLQCFLKEERESFKNQAGKEAISDEYKNLIIHLSTYLDLICKTEKSPPVKKTSFLKLSRYRRVKSELTVTNPGPDAYISNCYLNHRLVLAMRKYIAMNQAFLAGYLNLDECKNIKEDEDALITCIINKNINAVSDITLLFTPKNVMNHYANYLNKTLDGYYQSANNIPENLKSGKIQKLIKTMLAKLISEGLDVGHFDNCLKSPFHLAKDVFGEDDFTLQTKNPNLSAMLTQFQRFFMESFLNNLTNLYITHCPPEQDKTDGQASGATPLDPLADIKSTDVSIGGKIPLSERNLTAGFNKVIAFFAQGNKDELLGTDIETLWLKIKAQL